MATNSNQRNPGSRGSAAARAAEAKKREAKKKRKVIIFGLEIAVILVMVGVLYFVMNGTSGVDEIKRLELNEEALAIPSKVQVEKEEGGAMHGYMNIALFGVDARNEKQLLKGSRSDSTMIASVNLDTGDIKLVSVYRDTYLNLGNDKYDKCNGAYSAGGAEQAIKMLNMNLDMDITNFVTVGYRGLSEVIDGLGGVYIEIDSEELKHINNYQLDIADVLKCEYTPVKETGYQLLNGIQATAYCRIRYTKGDDFQRTARQREVIKAIEERAKQASLEELTKAFNNAAPYIYTSINNEDILGLLKNISNYRIVEEGGFPEETMRTADNIGAKGSCVIPWTGDGTGLTQNVEWLHHFFFEDEEYTVSNTVVEISQKVYQDTAPYIN